MLRELRGKFNVKLSQFQRLYVREGGGRSIMIGVFAGNKTSDNTADNMPDNTELDATITSISCTATKYDIKFRMGQNEFWEKIS